LRMPVGKGRSRPFRDLQPALHRRARQATFEPGGDMPEAVERHEVAGTVEANEVARPAEQGNVGNAVFLLHHPPPSVEMLLEYAEQAPRFRDVALERTLVGDLLAGKFVEIADLAEHRPDAAHLEMYPLDGLVSARSVGRQQLTGFLGEILQDRPGFEQPERYAGRPIRIDDRRDLAIRIERQELRRLLVILVEIDEVHLVR